MQKKTIEQEARLLLDQLICDPQIAPFLNDLKEKSIVTFIHSMNVAFISVQMGLNRGFKGKKLENLAKGALLHDIGKLKVDPSILKKKEALTDEEYDIIKQHPITGCDMVKDLPFDDEVRNIIRHHHEKLDGSGYPDGLRSAKISVETQLVTVADVWDAMTSERAYKTEYTGNIALTELKDYKNSYYDEEVIRLLTMCSDK